MALINDIIAWEEGTMPTEDVIPFFQGLIDTGQVWALQGSYGRAAVSLIEGGHCHLAQHERTR